MTTVGAGKGSKQLRVPNVDGVYAGVYPGYDRILSYPEVDNVTLLASRGRKSMERGRRPKDTITAEVKLSRDLSLGAWRVGDYVRVRSANEYEPFDHFRRIVSWELTVAGTGEEQVTVDFAPADA